MRKKIYLMTTVMFAIVLFFAGCNSGSQKDKETTKVKDQEKVEESSTKNVTYGKMNDAMLVEISAQITYITTKYADYTENITPEEMVQIGEKMAKEMEDTYKKLGITEDKISAYSEKMEKKYEKNPVKLAKIYKQIAKRLGELQKQGKQKT